MSETDVSKLAADLRVDPAHLAKLDPYFLAAWVNGFADYHLAVDVRGETLYALAGVAVWPLSEADQASILKFLDLSAQKLCTDKEGAPHDTARYFTADVTRDQLLALIQLPAITELQLCAASKTCRPLPISRFGNAESPEWRSPVVSKKKKIIGLMDHGCAFAHRHLCDAGRSATRVLAIWDQDPHPELDSHHGSRPNVPGLQYGRQIDRAALNSCLGAGSDHKIYQAACYSALDSDFTHGTLTLGLLAGQYLSPSLSRAPGLGPATAEDDMDDVDIVFVQIPRAVALCPNRGSVDRISYDALRYMLACAPDDAKVVVVVDYGTEMGPHDGSSWFERAVDQLVLWAQTQRKITLEVVFPSGNSHEEQRHAKMQFGVAGTCSVYWDVPYGNGAAVFTEIWCPADMQTFTVLVTAPGHTLPVSLAVTPDMRSPFVRAFAGGTLTMTRQHAQVCVLLTVSATETKPGLAGRWCISISSPEGHEAPVCLYTAWGGKNPGLVQRLWPCRFESAQLTPQHILPTINGSGSLLGSACGQQTTMAGGYEKWQPGYRAGYSGGGPARGGRRAAQHGADVLCVVEEASSLPGVLSLGACSGPWYRAAGTSFAAPQWARARLSSPATTPHTPPSPPAGPYFGMGPPRSEYGEPRC
jgi:hypothetical protein